MMSQLLPEAGNVIPSEKLPQGELKALRFHNSKNEEQLRSEFEQLFFSHRKRAYNLAYRLTGSAVEAEDVSQEAFMRAWRMFHTFDHTYSFGAWLSRIITNLTVDRYRRRKNVKLLSLDQPISAGRDEELMEVISDEGIGNPEAQVLDGIMDEDLQRALNALPDKFRTAVLLADVEEMTYEEIAEITNANIGTVRSRIHRGRQNLRDSMRRSRRLQVSAA